MAKKRTTMAKKPTPIAKKATTKAVTRVRGALTLTAAQRQKAEKCLDRSGKIVVGFKTVDLLKVPRTIRGLQVRID
jgi:hypothetical protein